MMDFEHHCQHWIAHSSIWARIEQLPWRLTDSYYPFSEARALSVHNRTLTQPNNNIKLNTFFYQQTSCGRYKGRYNLARKQ